LKQNYAVPIPSSSNLPTSPPTYAGTAPHDNELPPAPRKTLQGQAGQGCRRVHQLRVDGAVRMSNMINDLLEYSRIQTRAGSSACQCRAYSGHGSNNLEVTIKENMAIVTHDPLPVVSADPTQFAQLFQNLIGNAVSSTGVNRLGYTSRRKRGKRVGILGQRQRHRDCPGISGAYF